jgi:hypothetical protein
MNVFIRLIVSISFDCHECDIFLDRIVCLLSWQSSSTFRFYCSYVSCLTCIVSIQVWFVFLVWIQRIVTLDRRLNSKKMSHEQNEHRVHSDECARFYASFKIKWQQTRVFSIVVVRTLRSWTSIDKRHRSNNDFIECWLTLMRQWTKWICTCSLRIVVTWLANTWNDKCLVLLVRDHLIECRFVYLE